MERLKSSKPVRNLKPIAAVVIVAICAASVCHISMQPAGLYTKDILVGLAVIALVTVVGVFH